MYAYKTTLNGVYKIKIRSDHITSTEVTGLWVFTCVILQAIVNYLKSWITNSVHFSSSIL